MVGNKSNTFRSSLCIPFFSFFSSYRRTPRPIQKTKTKGVHAHTHTLFLQIVSPNYPSFCTFHTLSHLAHMYEYCIICILVQMYRISLSASVAPSALDLHASFGHNMSVIRGSVGSCTTYLLIGRVRETPAAVPVCGETEDTTILSDATLLSVSPQFLQ